MRVPLNTAPFSSRPTSVSGDISIRPTCITSGDNALAVGVLETAPSRVASTCVSGDNVRTPNSSIKKHLKSCHLHIRRQRWLRYNALGVGVLGNSALSNRPILHIKGQRGGRDNLHPLSRRSRVVQLAYKETTRWLLYGDNE